MRRSNESNRADYISRALRDYWSQWPEVIGVCPYELVDPFGQWQVWDWLYTSGARHQQADVVRAMDKTPPTVSGTFTIRFQARASQAPGSYTGRLQVQGPDILALDLTGVAPVQVIPAPATPTASATPTATGSPTPTGHSDALHPCAVRCCSMAALKTTRPGNCPRQPIALAIRTMWYAQENAPCAWALHRVSQCSVGQQRVKAFQVPE